MASTSEPSSIATETLALEASGLVHRFADASVGPIDLAIPSGAIAALVGPNGAGKSTLLELFAGRLTPTTGTIRWLGSASRCAIGYAAQHAELDPDMSGREHLALFAALERIPRGHRAAAIEETITRFSLGAFVDRRVATLSGGMRRRLHLASSWLASPRLLLLDEPTTGLDPEGLRALEDAIVGTRGCTVVLTGHDLAFVDRVATHAFVVARGTIACGGTTDALRERHGSLESAYRAIVGDDPIRASGARRGRMRG